MNSAGLERVLAAVLRPVTRRIRMIATRALIAAVNDGAKIQIVQVTALEGERLSDVQRVQQFGFSGSPPVGSTAVLLCMGGSRTHPVVIACDDPATRFVALEAGESAQYSAYGDFIRIKADGSIHVKAALKVLLETPLVEATQDFHVMGNAQIDGTLGVTEHSTLTGDATIAGKVFSTHTHTGVTPGGGNTGAPT